MTLYSDGTTRPETLDLGWSDIGWIDETSQWLLPDLKPIQDKINRDLTRLSQVALSSALFKPPSDYDIRWRDSESTSMRATMEAARVMMESLPPRPSYYGLWLKSRAEVTESDWRDPLADQEIPAEGTE